MDREDFWTIVIAGTLLIGFILYMAYLADMYSLSYWIDKVNNFGQGPSWANNS